MRSIVNIQIIKDLILKIKRPFTDPTFFSRIFQFISKEKKLKNFSSKDPFEMIVEEDYGDISRRADYTKIQESSLLRNTLKTRSIANYMVTDKGDILFDKLDQMIDLMKKHLYSLAPGREHDRPRQELILKALRLIKEDKEIQSLLKSISKPYLNKNATEIIRNTLQLNQNDLITDAHTKRAVISALLSYLRQSVGSCFGTAPSILIHNEQPKQFLRDLIELLGTGRLKRTFNGVEYSVPLSYNFGIGDLKKTLIFSEDRNFEQIEIWYSPGLIEALSNASLFNESDTLKNKIEKTKELTLSAIERLKKGKDPLLTNVEELIRSILLDHLGLQEENILDFEIKETKLNKEGLITEISYNQSTTSVSRNKIEHFLNLFEIAITSFKTLVDNALLKSWEFTIASFTENKAGFTTWNLYSSLGFQVDAKGGLGETLYEILKVKLNENNHKVQEFQEEYDQAYNHLKYLETRLRTSSTDTEVQWIKSEYQFKVHEFRFLEEMKEKIHYKAKKIASLFDVLIDIYQYLFQQYFQEVYDAGMQDVKMMQYDDSPAGFRLLFKYGRGNTAQWIQILNADQFIDALVSFFTLTELEIKSSAEMEGLEDEYSAIVTALIQKIREKEFLESAFYRMAIAHQSPIIKNPLENLDKIEKKPWAYVSGGSMATLVQTYFKLDQKPKEVSRWVENPTELFVFLADSMKELPTKIKELYLNDQDRSMLMHSPTHAFLLKPGFKAFREVWQNELFTYTYIRDQIITPQERFLRSMNLDDEMMDYFIEDLISNVSVNFKHHIKSILKPIYKTLTPFEFRNHLVDQIERDRSLSYLGNRLLSSEDIDSKLYSSLPYFYSYQLKSLVLSVLEKIPEINKMEQSKIEEIIDSIYESRQEVKILSSKHLQEICKAVIVLSYFKSTSEIDFDLLIYQACQDLGLALKAPVIFADSNWVKDYFAFVLNPGTLDLEFWRVDSLGRTGAPMSSWKPWLNGSRHDLTWGIYTNPYEYSYSDIV